MWRGADGLVGLQFPRFDADQAALTTRLTRILLPAQIFFIAGGVLRGALMARGHFAAQSAAPVIYNGAIILFGLALGPTLGAEQDRAGTPVVEALQNAGEDTVPCAALAAAKDNAHAKGAV